MSLLNAGALIGEFLNGLIDATYKDHDTKEHRAINSMRAGAGIVDDPRFQAEALATALFLTNLLPSVTLDNQSPHLLLKGPPLDFLKPWGCRHYINLRKEQREKKEIPAVDPPCSLDTSLAQN
jgi:hypothetical protein